MSKKIFVLTILGASIFLILFLLFLENIVYPDSPLIAKIGGFVILIIGIIRGSIRVYRIWVK